MMHVGQSVCALFKRSEKVNVCGCCGSGVNVSGVCVVVVV